MSRLEELIQGLCPDGVEYKRIKDIAQVLRGKRLTKDMLSDDGEYPVYHGGLDPLGYYTEKNREANTVMIINVGASAGTVGFSDADFWSSDGCYCLSHNKYTLPKFIYVALSCKEALLMSKVRKAGIPTLDAKVIENIEIPVPPLPVQEEIVRILDKFTDYVTELQAELQARKQQYEYYKQLLLYEAEDEVLLSDVAFYVKDRIDASEVEETTYIGVDNLLQNCEGKTISSHVPESGKLIKYQNKDILIGNIRPYLKKIWYADNFGATNGDVLTIRVKNECVINPRYLYYVLSSDDFFIYDMSNSKGAKMPRGDKEAVMKYKFRLPSLNRQKQTINILNRFDDFCNSISSGLPAEIEARQKQYEYYRDKLLSFKELT